MITISLSILIYQFLIFFKDTDISENAFEDKGNTIITNSDFLTDLPYKKAFKLVSYEMEKQGIGYKKINFRLRDAVFQDNVIGENLFLCITKMECLK